MGRAVGVTTLGVHPGDKTLLPLDIMAPVVLAMDMFSPMYTWHTSHMIAFLTTAISTAPSTVGPLREIVDVL